MIDTKQAQIDTLGQRLQDGFHKTETPVVMRVFVVKLPQPIESGSGALTPSRMAPRHRRSTVRNNPTPTCYRCKKTQSRDAFEPKVRLGRSNGIDQICRACRAEMAQTPIDNGDGTFWIPFGRGHRALVDAEDVAVVSALRWYPVNSGYAFAVEGDGHRIGMHRLILGLARDDDRVGDHISRDKLDNRRANLRAVTYAENNRRRAVAHRPGETSQFRGVSWTTSKRRWRAAITVNYRCKCLGYFREEHDAAMAYDAAAREHYGEFAVLNFPDELEVA